MREFSGRHAVVKIFILMIIFHCQSVALAEAELKFEEFLNAAISANETNRINQSQALIFEARKDQAAATMMPQLKVIGSNTHQDISQSPKLNANASALKLNLTQPLLGIYKNRSAVAYAKQQMDAATYSADDSILQLKLALNDAYHAVLNAMGDIDSYNDVRSVAVKRANETAARVKIGRSRAADLYSAQAQLATIEAQLEQTKVAEAMARSSLAQLSGLPEDILISDSVKLPEAVEPVEGLINSAESLPSVKYIAAQKSMVDTQTDSVRAQRIPDLDFFTNYYLHREIPLDKVKWDVGVQLTWALYDGGLISAKVRESRSQYQIYDEQLSQKKRITFIKIRQTHEQLGASLRQIPILKKSWSLAQKSYDSIEQDYRVGLATILDLIQSSNAVADAKRQYNHQVINAKATSVALRLSAGNPL